MTTATLMRIIWAGNLALVSGVAGIVVGRTLPPVTVADMRSEVLSHLVSTAGVRERMPALWPVGYTRRGHGHADIEAKEK